MERERYGQATLILILKLGFIHRDASVYVHRIRMLSLMSQVSPDSLRGRDASIGTQEKGIKPDSMSFDPPTAQDRPKAQSPHRRPRLCTSARHGVQDDSPYARQTQHIRRRDAHPSSQFRLSNCSSQPPRRKKRRGSSFISNTARRLIKPCTSGNPNNTFFHKRSAFPHSRCIDLQAPGCRHFELPLRGRR
ncbi:hypothetical protein G7K_5609-t1 [Saitoella complicata NRRL Y-17804]|uniref:Uncharacterized protein n=1 Tax=Saitoella complicata (strain BCRC 22490 / CBS 7301 / JCM 7358 / NBRC 10748 / NRRL Y-17804) TaxID=698492 RepID=A0A0E9NQ07_SAICN|nr:hypothetical protein G7K_5609-t1 [Saitoella complicata NRRL Y-17804]